MEVDACLAAHDELGADGAVVTCERRAMTIKNLDTGDEYVIGENDPDFEFDTFELRGEVVEEVTGDASSSNHLAAPAAAQLSSETKHPEGRLQSKFSWWQTFTSLGGLLYTPTTTVVSRASVPVYRTSSIRTPFTKLSSFKFRKELGRGAFGRVLLAEAKTDGSLYALKIISKKNMRSSDRRQAKAERDILHAMGHTSPHPFTTGLKFAFQSENNLYLGMNFIAGGSLRELIKKHSCLPEAWVLFYSSELVLAISHLHSMHVLYRDIKPHNVMLDAEGHIQIIDFGLSKQEIDHPRGAMSLVGTPDYSAPEVLKTGVYQLEASKKARQQAAKQTLQAPGNTLLMPRIDKCKPKNGIGYGKAADWWSLGVMIYEMLTGTPAFRGADLRQTYQKVLFAELEFVPADKFSPSTRTLLTGLLQRDPALRLGADSNPPLDIMSAHFFEGVNWDRVYDRAIPAPIVPSLTYRRRESGKPTRTNTTGDVTQSATQATESEAAGGDELKSKLAPAVLLDHAPTNTNGVLFSDAPSSSSTSCSSATSTAAAVTATEQVTEATDSPTAGQSAPSTPSTQSESDELMNLRDSVFVGRGEENRLQDWSFCDEKVLLEVSAAAKEKLHGKNLG